MAREYEGQNYRIYVDIEGYPKPATIGGHRPDMLAVKRRYRIILAIETLDSLRTPYAAMRDAAFQRACRRSPLTHYRRVIAR